MNFHSPFPPGLDQMRFDVGVGEAAAAALYVGSNIYSWSEAKRMPDRQAEANKKVLTLQKQHYDELSKEQRKILNAATDKYLSSVDARLSSTDFEEAFPDVPEAAEYVPVDACCIQGSTIECNISATDRAEAYISYVNRLHERNDLAHALSYDSRFLVNLDIVSKSLQDMMRGILPVGDVVEVLSDNAEQASLTGRIGNTRKTTARDLGISKLRIQAAGRREFRDSTQWANTVVSPMQRQHDITEMMQTPAQRISLALAQSQLIQQSLQNKNNALAQKAPYKMAELQTRLQQYITRLQAKSSEALLVNSHIPNFAAIVPSPTMSNVSDLVSKIGDNIPPALKSHFFGTNQDGYSGAGTPSDVASTARNMSDRPSKP